MMHCQSTYSSDFIILRHDHGTLPLLTQQAHLVHICKKELRNKRNKLYSNRAGTCTFPEMDPPSCTINYPYMLAMILRYIWTVVRPFPSRGLGPMLDPQLLGHSTQHSVLPTSVHRLQQVWAKGSAMARSKASWTAEQSGVSKTPKKTEKDESWYLWTSLFQMQEPYPAWDNIQCKIVNFKA